MILDHHNHVPWLPTELSDHLSSSPEDHEFRLLLLQGWLGLLEAIVLTNVFRSQNQTCFLLNQRTTFNVNSAGVFIQASLLHFKTCRAFETLQNRCSCWYLLPRSPWYVFVMHWTPAFLSLPPDRQEPWQLLRDRGKKEELGLLQLSH